MQALQNAHGQNRLGRGELLNKHSDAHVLEPFVYLLIYGAPALCLLLLLFWFVFWFFYNCIVTSLTESMWSPDKGAGSEVTPTPWSLPTAALPTVDML